VWDEGALACAHGHGILADEAWLARLLPRESYTAWRRALVNAAPTTLGCSACQGEMASVSFLTSWWSLLRAATFRGYPVPYIVSTEVSVVRCVACSRTWFDLLDLEELRDLGPLFNPMPSHEPPQGVCPRCYHALGAEGRCERHGRFVRGSTLKDLLGARASAIAAALARAPGGGPLCAGCGRHGRRLALDGREVGACSACLGVWLDLENEDIGPRLPELLDALA